MKAWVLGSSGMLGAYFCFHFQKKGIPFIGTSKQEVDITSREKLFSFFKKEIQITHIINCAAFTDVDLAEKEEKLAYAVNAEGPKYLADLAQLSGAKLLHLSSDYVFDGTKQKPYTEEDPCRPLSVYGKTKREGEERLLKKDPSAIVLRTSWLFGQRGKNFFSTLFEEMQKKEQIVTVDDQWSCICFCRDLVEVALQLFPHSGIFHFANSGITSRYLIAQALQKEAQKRKIPLKCKRILPISSKDLPSFVAKRPSYSVLDTSKIENTLEREIPSWQEALSSFLSEKISNTYYKQDKLWNVL